jgi:Ca2+:H+ antiporter
MHPLDAVPVSSNPAGRSLYNRIVSSQMTPLPSHLTASHRGIKRQRSNLTATGSIGGGNHPPQQPSVPSSPTQTRRISYAPVPHGSAAQAPPFTSNVPLPTPYTTILESVDTAVKNTTIPNMQLPPNFTTEDFSRAVAVATVSALRHQVEPRGKVEGHDDGDAAGHEGPSWSRTTSASVLLACTALYAVIAG